MRAKSRLKVEQRGLQFLGDTVDWCYFVVPDEVAATKFLGDLAAYESGSGSQTIEDFFADVDGIEPYDADDRRGNGLPDPGFSGSTTVDVLLWPSSDGDEASGRLEQVESVVETLLGEVLDRDRRPLSTMARVRVSSPGLDTLLELMVVERVRAPAKPFLEPSVWFNVGADDLTAESPIDVTIGVIDDGVHVGHPLLESLVDSQINVPSGRQWGTVGTHGSMVAGLAAYGDIEKPLRDGGPFPAPARLSVVRVLEPDPNNQTATVFASDTPEHLVVEEAIRALHDQGVRIINLSIADDHPYSGPHVGLWTESLDRLARELDVLIVAAAGNRRIAASGQVTDDISACGGYPGYTLDAEARIAEPGIAASVVAVGSIARSGASASPSRNSDLADVAIAGENQLSPFSRTGPGLNCTFKLGALKPDFVHYGGNCVRTSLGHLNYHDHGAAVVSTSLGASGRLFSSSSGTSYAAPRVARIAAEILHAYPTAGANLLRALLGISAEVPHQARSQFPDKESRRAFGYGMPDKVRAVNSERARVVLFHEGEIDVDTVAIHPIPMPESFTTGKSDRTITVAVAHDPPVRRQRREYTAGHLELDFYRAMSIDEVEEVVRGQPEGELVPTVKDRRRVAHKLEPGSQTCGSSTLQVRTWHAKSANSLNLDDSDTYYLVVKHLKEPWADNLKEGYTSQKYALAVQLEDRSRIDIDLYADVQSHVRVRARAETRTDG